MSRLLAGIDLVAGHGRGLPAGARAPGPLTRAWARVRGRSLDHALAGGADPASSAALASRAAWLTSRRNRRGVARAIRRLLEPPGRRGPSAAVRPHRGELAGVRLRLAGVAALLETEEPIYASGVARAQLLLTDGNSPLYQPLHAGDLLRTVDEIVDALEGREETW